MGASKAKIFQSNKSQAVRLPKPVALPDSVTTVEIIPVGRGRLLVPEGDRWSSWFEGEQVTDDFMESRDQPADQERESFD